jgi:Zn-dependent protease
VLYSLADIQTFVLLLAGLFLAWGVHVGAQRLVQSRIPETKWLLQHRSGIAGFVDPFAAVAAILGTASAGWTPPVEWNSHRGSKRPLVTLLLSGPLGNLIVGGGALAGFGVWAGHGTAKAFLGLYRNNLGDFVDVAQVHRVVVSDATGTVLSSNVISYGQRALLLAGLLQLIVAVISLIPLPPLEGGRLLFLYTPKTSGWQKAEYQLAERNIGLILVLVGLIRISNGIVPPFAYLADVISHGLAVLFAGM